MDMDKRTIWSFKVKVPTLLTARSGAFWITRKNDPTDYFVAGGQTLSLPRGSWLVQALAEGAVDLVNLDCQPVLVGLARGPGFPGLSLPVWCGKEV